MVNVFDANVKKWEVTKKNESSQTVVVDLDQPAKGQQPLVLELEHVSPELVTQGVKIPAVKAVDAARQFGVVAVRVSPTLQAELAAQNGLSQLDHHELPGDMAKQGGWTFAYRFSAVPYALQLTLAQVQPRIEATEFVEVYVEPRQITIDLLASLLIERAGIFSMDVDLPEGFSSAKCCRPCDRDVPLRPLNLDNSIPKIKRNSPSIFLARRLEKLLCGAVGEAIERA